MWAQCLEQGRHLDVPGFFFCTGLNILLLSVNEEACVWLECLRWCQAHKRTHDVLPALGREQILHCTWVSFLERLVLSLPITECWWLGWEGWINSLHLIDAEG